MNEDRRLDPGSEPERRSRWWLRGILIGVAVLAIALAGFGLAAFAMSGSSLGSDPSALARVETEALGGTIEAVHATGPNGKSIPIAVHDGRLIPEKTLSPGEQVSVDVVVKRPSAVAWLVGEESEEHLTLRAPKARVSSRWLTVHSDSAPRVSFDRPVLAVAYGVPGHLRHRVFSHPRKSVSLGSQAPVGTVIVAGVPRSWERPGRPQSVTWFPASKSPSVAASPAPGTPRVARAHV